MASWLKKISKFFATALAVSAFLIAGFFLWASDKYVVPILAYHHIDDIPTYQALNLNIVSPASFEKQMRYLHDSHYTVIQLDSLVNMIKEGKKPPRKSVVITFDDGYENVYTHAYPILKKYEFPATIFVLADFIGAQGYLTLEQMKEMYQHGIFMGAHSRTHAYLPDLTYEGQEEEIVGSKRIIEQKLRGSVNYFAYPSGGFNNQIKKIVKEAGFLGACTTNRGFYRYNQDVYELKRIRIKDTDTTVFSLWAKLSGYYNLFRRIKNPA